jgi:2-keto-3-deoxy-L-rhamnonate aldolase RhmA
MSLPERFILAVWTNDPQVACYADWAGIDRVGVDLETVGKAARQSGLATWISPHREQDIPGIRRALSGAQLFVRTNPLHPGSADEIERVLALGAQVLMQPYFKSAGEVAEYLAIVDRRAAVVPLLETQEAVESLPAILELDGIDEIHIGLNDLSLSLKLSNRFELLVSDVVAKVAAGVHEKGLRLGIGGIGKAMDEDLPIPSDLIYAQYARLGATSALVARSFLERGAASSKAAFRDEVRQARARLAYWFCRGADELALAQDRLRAALAKCGGW